MNTTEKHRPAKITARACSREQLRNRRPSYLPKAFFGWHLASMAASLTLKNLGRQKDAPFVGQWRRLCKSHLHVPASKIAFNLMKNRVIIQAPPQPVLLLSGFEDPPGEFQAFGFDPIALFSSTLLELRVVESA